MINKSPMARFESRRLDQNSRITIGGTAVFDSTACDGIRGTSYPLSKALVMPCRDEMSKRINFAFAVTERKENRTLREKSRFAGAKRFALRYLDYGKLDGKGRR